MRSCDLFLLSEMLKDFNYNEAVLCSGINNQINIMEYGGNRLYILQGRGIHFVDEILERLMLDYRCGAAN